LADVNNAVSVVTVLVILIGVELQFWNGDLTTGPNLWRLGMCAHCCQSYTMFSSKYCFCLLSPPTM